VPRRRWSPCSAILGGASIVLWITDPAAPAPRPTKDVDVVVEVTSRTGFHAFEERLRSLGFKENQEDGIVCRWRHRDDDLILDAMPADAAILGLRTAGRERRSRTPTSP
jgi:hypothetical protein